MHSETIKNALYSVEFNIYLQDLYLKVAAECQSCYHIQCPALHLIWGSVLPFFYAASSYPTSKITYTF